jgi:hypothetical protein
VEKAASQVLQEIGIPALSRMEEALKLLDRCDCADEVGPHLDLAICRLRELLAREGINVRISPSGPDIAADSSDAD